MAFKCSSKGVNFGVIIKFVSTFYFTSYSNKVVKAQFESVILSSSEFSTNSEKVPNCIVFWFSKSRVDLSMHDLYSNFNGFVNFFE